MRYAVSISELSILINLKTFQNHLNLYLVIVNDFEPNDFCELYDKFMQSQLKTTQTDCRVCEVSHVWGDPMLKFSLKRNKLYTKVLLT